MIVILEGFDCEIIETLSFSLSFFYFFSFPLILQLLPLFSLDPSCLGVL